MAVRQFDGDDATGLTVSKSRRVKISTAMGVVRSPMPIITVW